RRRVCVHGPADGNLEPPFIRPERPEPCVKVPVAEDLKVTRRALVLGGGGITGIGWELGMLAGLCAAGVDLIRADVVVGTSAGSVVGAQIRSGVAIEDL